VWACLTTSPRVASRRYASVPTCQAGRRCCSKHDSADNIDCVSYHTTWMRLGGLGESGGGSDLKPLPFSLPSLSSVEPWKPTPHADLAMPR